MGILMDQLEQKGEELNWQTRKTLEPGGQLKKPLLQCKRRTEEDQEVNLHML